MLYVKLWQEIKMIHRECIVLYLRLVGAHNLFTNEAKTASQEPKSSGTEIRETHETTISCSMRISEIWNMKSRKKPITYHLCKRLEKKKT